MNADERRSLAEQILNNPLFSETMKSLEGRAIERLVHETTDIHLAQLRVQAIRTFRTDLEQSLETHLRRGAPA